MSEDTTTPPDQSAVTDALAKISEQMTELATRPGLDSDVQKAIAEAITEARGVADAAVAERQAAKDSAAKAMDQVTALRADLHKAKVLGAARDAGAVNPERVAQLVSADVADDKIPEAIKALSESDPYMFGSAEQAKTGSGGFDFNGGQTTQTTQVDDGLKAFGDEMSKITGVT